MNPRLLLTLSLLACSAASAARWDSVYFHDHATEVLEFVDIASPSSLRAIAVGVVHDTVRERKDRYVAVVTSDSGDTWQQVKLDDVPVSLFFLNDSTGWMVTGGGVWKTEESGRSWMRLSKHGAQEILRLWFLDANHGFGVGAKKNVVETTDGGRTWTKVRGAKSPPGDPNLSFYSRIAFVNPKVGIILGTDLSSLTPRSLRPRATTRMLQLETEDGGATWEPEASPSGGIASGLRFNGDEGLTLIHFADTRGREIANVFHLHLRNKQPPSVVYEGKDLHVTDIGLYKDHAFLVGIDAAKNTQLENIPRRVRILESTGAFKLWEEMQVDYNAQATHLLLAGADADHVFVATSDGMILRLKR